MSLAEGVCGFFSYFGSELMASMASKVVLVTGANTGIGFHVAQALARRDAHVVMACRNRARAEEARAQILKTTPNASLSTLVLDISEPASVKAFLEMFKTEVGQLHVLIHNAGIFGVPLAQNSRGNELHLATNYLGPFALTAALLNLFQDPRGGRIVSVGSLTSRFGKVDTRDLNGKPTDYKPTAAYARSKLALLNHTMELQRRLQRRGSNVIALGAHPGFARTGIAKHHTVSGNEQPAGWLRRRVRAMMMSVEEAAAPIVHAASADDVRGGEYFGPSGWFEITGAPGPARLSRKVRDEALARRLWSATEALTGVHFLSEP